MKVCPRCRKGKSLDSFSFDKSSKSGRVSACKECEAERLAGYYASTISARRRSAARYRAENAESIAERDRERYVYNRDAKAKARARHDAENPTIRRAAVRRQKERDAAIDASRNHEPWTSHEDATLTSWTGGQRELGAVLNRSRQAVSNRIRTLRKRAAEQPASNEGGRP